MSEISVRKLTGVTLAGTTLPRLAEYLDVPPTGLVDLYTARVALGYNPSAPFAVTSWAGRNGGTGTPGGTVAPNYVASAVDGFPGVYGVVSSRVATNVNAALSGSALVCITPLNSANGTYRYALAASSGTQAGVGVNASGQAFATAGALAPTVLTGGSGLLARSSVLGLTWNDGTKQVILYVDGVQVGAATTYTGSAPDAPFSIGQLGTSTSFGLTGSVHAAAIYNVVLTPADMLRAARALGGMFKVFV